METIDLQELLSTVPSYELRELVEGLLSDDLLRMAQPEEQITLLEAERVTFDVDDYSDEQVFSEYMDLREKMGDPLDLVEYFADRRQWEYESQEPDFDEELDY